MSTIAVAYIVLTLGMFGFDLVQRLYEPKKDWTAIAVGTAVITLGLATFL